MKKAGFVVFTALSFLLCSAAQAQIQSISVDYVTTGFTPSGGDYGLGVLTLSDLVDIVVEDVPGGQVTYDDGFFSTSTSLKQDNSSGGIAIGRFEGGSLSFTDKNSNILLSGDILSLDIEELTQVSGILAGAGQFLVTGGAIEDDFGSLFGDIVQITFRVKPSSISNFNNSFTGVSDVTLIPVMAPVPEPTTMALLGLGVLGLLRRKK